MLAFAFSMELPATTYPHPWNPMLQQPSRLFFYITWDLLCRLGMIFCVAQQGRIHALHCLKCLTPIDR